MYKSGFTSEFAGKMVERGLTRMANLYVNPGNDIQSVINGAAAGDTVVFKAGSHGISKAVNLKSDVVYHGEAGATLKLNYNGNMFNVDNVKNATIEGLTFEGGTTKGSGWGGVILGNHADNLTIKDNTFQHFKIDAAVYIYNTSNLKIMDNKFIDLNQGVSFINDAPTVANSVTISHNNFSAIDRMGIEVQQAEQLQKVGINNAGAINGLYVDGNNFDNSAYPNGALQQPLISLVGGTFAGEKTSIQNNDFKNVYWAIEIDNRDTTVENNHMDNVKWGIGISDAPNTSIQNNTFVNSGTLFGEVGGYVNHQWVGTNIDDGNPVNGWDGHPNTSATPPASAGRQSPTSSDNTPDPTPAPTPDPTPTPPPTPVPTENPTFTNANFDGDRNANVIIGNDLNNRIDGRGGDDTIKGGAGNDVIVGGSGNDKLWGGTGNDPFYYTNVNPSVVGKDTIFDFEHGKDKINVHDADANSRASGNQNFKFIGSAHVSHAGELGFLQDTAAGVTYVQTDTNGDAQSDLVITVQGIHTFTANDFIL